MRDDARPRATLSRGNPAAPAAATQTTPVAASTLSTPAATPEVRFVRTPDHLLRARRAAAESRKGTGDPAQIVAEAAGVDPLAALPSWLQPFTLASNARFTRTPDRIGKGRLAPSSKAPEPTEALAAPMIEAVDASAIGEPRPMSRGRRRMLDRQNAARLAAEAEELLASRRLAESRAEAVSASEEGPVTAAEPGGLDDGGKDAIPPRLFEIADAIRLGAAAMPPLALEQDNLPRPAGTPRTGEGSPIEGAASRFAFTAPVGASFSWQPFWAGVSATPDAASQWAIETTAEVVDESDEEDDAVDDDETDGEDAGENDAIASEPQPTPARPVRPAARAPARLPAPSRMPSAARIAMPVAAPKPARAAERPEVDGDYELPPLPLLAEPKKQVSTVSKDTLEQNATLLESTLEDFGVRGEIINVRPGPVVTLYELEPAPGTKSSKVIGLADDIARSMSAISARVAVVPGHNAIGIELPNQKRETVYLRELIASEDFAGTNQKLALCLGKNIGGEPIIADLAKMPHLLVAGTTGSGKSVAINTMILSLLYRHSPAECRLIMVDPKMLELSVYDGIPHLLTPVVTDPKKAVIALKWAVREMEERYKKMSKLGVRNIDGFNARVVEASARAEVITRTVQSGFDRHTGEIVYVEEEMDLSPLPYIVVIVDEMADLMMVAGKDIEGAIQRLAQMARAAGIHLIMATQRPSVDVITGTIKANFPTRISFQVTSKIDSRTILGEMGAEQLLGQGDMLYMAGGGRITRVHGPFVSDGEVEQVVAHLKAQGRPQYLDAVTTGEDELGGTDAGGQDEAGGAIFDKGSFGEEGGDLYDQAIQVVLRDKKASTSYIQRRLGIGYNRAASLMERMETEGIVGPANHAGKRDILVEQHDWQMSETG